MNGVIANMDDPALKMNGDDLVVKGKWGARESPRSTRLVGGEFSKE